ncbi:hypothetical protein Ciccas_012615 [Cichlidogyrus casuarinus]|uniref:G-protein coupled receptors family 1 profile domain-containing protein n=1 Tax=Cichlidogyrus casuarinus TaxID=1844966 RepID=A0ABD2PP41_9PLAT
MSASNNISENEESLKKNIVPQFDFIMYFYVQTIIIAIGIILNIINVSIFSQRRFNATTYVYMSAIALADIVTLATSLIPCHARCNSQVVGQEFCDRSKNFRHGIAQLLPVEHSLSSFTETVSAWITVVVAVERYITMRWPTSLAKTYFNLKAGRIHVLLVVVLAFALNSPTMFAMGVVRTNKLTVRATEFGESQIYAIYSWIRFISVQGIPLLLICFINYLLLRLMWRTMHSSTHSNYSKNKMLLPNEESAPCRMRTQLKINIHCFECCGNGSREYQGFLLGPAIKREQPKSRMNGNQRKMSQTLAQATNMANKQKERRQKAHNKLTILLIAVIILFLVGQIPSALAYKKIHPAIFPASWFSVYKTLARTFLLFTLCCTFFLYVSLNKHFRNALCMRAANFTRRTPRFTSSHFSEVFRIR